MDKICCHILAFLIIVACTTVIEAGVGGRSSQSRGYAVYPHYYKSSGYRSGAMYGLGNPYNSQKVAAKAPPPVKKGGHGLTAWGIVGIILAVIFCGTGVYYCARFYPIFCKKERNDNFEL